MAKDVESHSQAATLPAPAAREESPFADNIWQPAAQEANVRGPERILLEAGRVTREQIEKARQRQQANPRASLLDMLVQAGVLNDVEALQAVAKYFKLPFLRIQSAEVDAGAFAMLPVAYLRAKMVLPVGRGDQGVCVALSDPADIFLIDDLKHRLKGRVQLAVATPGDIVKAIEDLSADPTQQVDDIIKDISEDSVEVVDKQSEEVADLEMLAGESPVIRYVNYLISSAVRDGASDIHIEPQEKRLRIRYRIDGILFDQQAPPGKMHAAIISRLKIMANLDIAERRLPQDGRIRACVHGRTVDLRVSILPIIHGEKCVIRILDNRSISVGLENLGMEADTLETFQRHILQPHGIVLVTGPTGSGKSTTLYSGMQIMDGDKLNISTVEDPVEYELGFCNQVHVNDAIGMSFSTALRRLLRQDPDVIMVGEIRDAETARIAIQAALTGHMVLSTLHTNDAPSSITRLTNIGIEPFLISAAVNACLAQRLVRKVCGGCKQPVTSLRESEKRYLEKVGASAKEFFQGVGCERCRQTGYKGRVGIYEVMEVSPEIRDLIARGPTLNELRAAAKASGMRTLREDGLLKAAAGRTTIEEIMRVTET